MANAASTALAPPAPKPGGAEPLRRAARELESVFLSQMLEHMSAGLSAEAPFGGGHAEKLWRSSLNEHYARSIAARGGIGISDAIYRDMLRWQEVRK
jgi:Rod binding domain-containing protein